MLSADAAPQRDDWDRHWLDYSRAVERNPAQRYRRRLIFGLLGLRESAARVLDIGSGTGDLAADLVERYPEVELMGLEVSAAGIAIAERKVPAARFQQRDLTRPERPPTEHRGWATHAVCSEVLEHVDRPQALLENVAPYLASGCRVVVTVPGGPMSAFDRHIGHRRHFTPHELRALLVEAGFDVESATGAGFPFFNLYRLAVIAAGRRLVEASREGSSSRLAGVAVPVFDLLFRLNSSHGQWGWQTVAVARAAGAAAD